MKKRTGLKTVLFLLLVLGLAGIGYRYLPQEYVAGLVRLANRVASIKKEPEALGRGTIYDRNFTEMAVSLERVSLFARPRELRDLGLVALSLGAILGVEESQLLESLKKDSQMVWLARNLSQEEEEKIRQEQIPGLYFHKEQARYYPNKETAAHLLGFAEEGQGLSGLERRYDQLLKRRSIDAGDVGYIDLGSNETTGNSGLDLVLTVDLKIQNHLERVVGQIGNRYPEGKVAALLIEPTSGEVVASGSYPTFDPNRFWDYPKGDLTTTLFDSMVVPQELRQFFKETARLQSDFETNGVVASWSGAKRKFNLGSQLRFWERLGFSAPLQFDMFNTSQQSTFFVSENIISTQELDCDSVPLVSTPIHLLLAFSQLLNGGSQVSLHSLDSIRTRKGEEQYSYVPVFENGVQKQLVDPVISEEAGRILLDMGKRNRVGGVSLSGEDVSLRMVEGGHEYVRNEVMVTAIPPIRPELILMLVVKRPFLDPAAKGKKGVDLVTLASDVLPSMVALQQIRSNIAGVLEVGEKNDDNYEQEITGEAPAAGGGSIPVQGFKMRDLKGLSVRKALRLVQETGVRVEVQGSGRVVSQHPKPGTDLDGVEQVELILKRDITGIANGTSVEHR
ncbi:MAG: PASTA domain-containing protein [Thermodesulfobacteriota bacterium]